MGIFVFSDGFDIFDFWSQFKQGLAVYLKVFDKSHRAVENFLSFIELTIGYHTLACVHEIIVLPFEREFHIIPHNAVIVEKNTERFVNITLVRLTLQSFVRWVFLVEWISTEIISNPLSWSFSGVMKELASIVSYFVKEVCCCAR